MVSSNINYWKRTEVYMHFWIILYFLDPWQIGLDFAEKEKQHFVPWLEKFWNEKSQEIEKKSRQNWGHRELQILL